MKAFLSAVGALFRWPPVWWAARWLAAGWAALAPGRQLRRLCAWRPHALVALGLLSALLTLQTLRFSSVTADWNVALAFMGKPLLFLLNWAPVACALGLFYCVTGRPYAAYALAGVPVLALALVNYYKLLLRGDPLLFADLGLVSEATAISRGYTFTPTFGVIVALLLTAGLTVLLHRRYRAAARPRARQRLLGGALCAAALLCYTRVLPSDTLYSSTALSVSWMPTQSYAAHGVLYPFLHSATALAETPPEGYEEASAAASLAAYRDAAIPDGEKVSIIAVMLEAFGDFSKFSTLDFVADPYADLHALMAESYSGELVVNVFAGETSNTERAFLTGYLDPSENFRAPVPSFAWYLRGQGYACIGDHPGYNWFYNRLNIDRYLGFEQYHFYEDRYKAYAPKGQIAGDAAFLPTVLQDYRAAAAGGKPVFSFNITYQNHGPYAREPKYSQTYLRWQDGYDEADYNIANNYLSGVADTGKQLAALADSLRGETRPVVLVAFGDHMPWWGDGCSTYDMFGLNLDRATQEGFYNYYTTPYLIWANDAAKAALGESFTGEGGRIGPYFLLERLFTLAGWDGPAYMQVLRALEARTPFVNRERWLENGVLTGGSAQDEPAWLQRFRDVEYYVKHLPMQAQ